MLDILPPLALLGWWAAFALRLRRLGQADPVRAGWLRAALTTGILVLCFSEFTSLARIFARPAIVALWSVATIAAFLYAAAEWRRARPIAWRRPRLATLEWAILAALAAILAVTLVIALAAEPNNPDSLAYHLPRAMHWLQNRSVAHYFTGNSTQLYQPPLAEMAIAQLYALAGSDRTANGVQWLAMAGSLLTVSLLAARLGGGRRAQLFAALFCATLPMGLLQATSTQNDYLLALWLATLAALLAGRDLRAGWAAAALGLALLTKAVAWLLAAPLGAWLLWRLLRERGRQAWRPLAPAAIVTLALIAPHYGRNLATYGNISGPDYLRRPGRLAATNDRHTPAVLVSNLLRNLALHAGTTADATTWLEWKLRILHRRLGLKPDDPATTFTFYPFLLNPLSLNEDVAGNPLHLALAVPILFWLESRSGRRRDRHALAASIAAAALLFCLYLKWMPWHSRLHLPLFVLLAPLAGLMLDACRPRALGMALALLLLVASTPWLLFNERRPLLGITGVFAAPAPAQLFHSRPDLRRPFEEAARFIHASGATRLGLALEPSAYEYPIWRLLGEPAAGRVRIDHYLEEPGVPTGQSPGLPPPQLLLVDDTTARGRADRLAGWKTISRRGGLILMAPDSLLAPR